MATPEQSRRVCQFLVERNGIKPITLRQLMQLEAVGSPLVYSTNTNWADTFEVIFHTRRITKKRFFALHNYLNEYLDVLRDVNLPSEFNNDSKSFSCGIFKTDGFLFDFLHSFCRHYHWTYDQTLDTPFLALVMLIRQNNDKRITFSERETVGKMDIAKILSEAKHERK